MSQALEKLETERLLEIKEILNTTRYNELKAKLTEIGAGDAWLQGEKKDIIVAKALQILNDLGNSANSENPESNTTDETINEEIVEPKEENPVVAPVESTDNKEELNEEVESENIVKEAEPTKAEEKVYSEDDPRNFVSKLTPNLSLKDLEKNLERIQLLMKGASQFHKMIYTQKIKQIEAAIKEHIKK